MAPGHQGHSPDLYPLVVLLTPLEDTVPREESPLRVIGYAAEHGNPVASGYQPQSQVVDAKVLRPEVVGNDQEIHPALYGSCWVNIARLDFGILSRVTFPMGCLLASRENTVERN